MMGERYDAMRIDYAVRAHQQWYVGDGLYGDGPRFHWDYYNSFVIQPMLLDVLRNIGPHATTWQPLLPDTLARARRYAAIQERLISPEGTFPVIGRSICYRTGAFQLLAQMALLGELPAPLTGASVRAALTAVMRRLLDAPGTFDDGGWLTVGFAGHQPHLGESYISTGSLYLCAAVFLPLGLKAGGRVLERAGGRLDVAADLARRGCAGGPRDYGLNAGDRPGGLSYLTIVVSAFEGLWVTCWGVGSWERSQPPPRAVISWTAATISETCDVTRIC